MILTSFNSKIGKSTFYLYNNQLLTIPINNQIKETVNWIDSQLQFANKIDSINRSLWTTNIM